MKRAAQQDDGRISFCTGIGIQVLADKNFFVVIKTELILDDYMSRMDEWFVFLFL